MDLDELLENRHTARLYFGERWPARGPGGNPLDANMEISATVHDCINLARAAAHAEGDRDLIGQDKAFLEEFIVVNWATDKSIADFST